MTTEDGEFAAEPLSTLGGVRNGDWKAAMAEAPVDKFSVDVGGFTGDSGITRFLSGKGEFSRVLAWE
ncbi:MAG: hypothetical protein U0350_47205 [Caldilineaceae bacterium]